jgi:hypothetical protein
MFIIHLLGADKLDNICSICQREYEECFDDKSEPMRTQYFVEFYETGKQYASLRLEFQSWDKMRKGYEKIIEAIKDFKSYIDVRHEQC